MPIIIKNRHLLFPRIGKYIILFFTIALVIIGIWAYQHYLYIFNDNVKNDSPFIIPPNSTFNEVLDTLEAHDILINYKAFKWVSKKKEYQTSIKTGRYQLKYGMNNNQIVSKLRAGDQDPLNITFNNVRTKEDLARKISRYLQVDSAAISSLFDNETLIKSYGFTKAEFPAMFIPNTYNFFWTTSADAFASRMKSEYDQFWNQQRRQKAINIGLSPVEVSTIASIIQEETAKTEELPTVAGVYINRVKRGMPLQADPTVKYAVGDFTLKRILKVHLETDSPYNTYLHAGLPPGPINFPEIQSIDAVLNFEKHNFLYMVAHEDFSGYHHFSQTLSEHNRYAARYHAALNSRGILK